MSRISSLSNTLIILSILATILVHLDSRFFVFWMNREFLDQWIYHVYFMQFFTSNFIHGSLLHLFFNGIFVYYFGNQVEYILGYQKYIVFFVLSAFFIWIGLTLLSSPYVNTIGISWFVLALVTYYTLHLRKIGDPEYKWWITAIVINILIGFTPQVSLLGHLLGVIFGGIYYYIVKTLKKRG